ncbi:MAG: nuclear transport factor 2 family protein [Gemmatimonadales bacterium]|nr:nuclear transport factor 2 family protein [Gemmatimonadales bacterium]
MLLSIVGAAALAVNGPPAARAAQRPSAEGDSLAIVNASRAFSAAYVRNDSSALGAVYADSAVLMPPGREIRGRSAIRRYFSWGPRYRQIAHAMTSLRLTINGNMAVDAGTWTSTSQRGDAPEATRSERYLIVWVREPDQRWRILYDMWHIPAP